MTPIHTIIQYAVRQCRGSYTYEGLAIWQSIGHEGAADILKDDGSCVTV